MDSSLSSASNEVLSRELKHLVVVVGPKSHFSQFRILSSLLALWKSIRMRNERETRLWRRNHPGADG
jgi:hypothetical protein